MRQIIAVAIALSSIRLVTLADLPIEPPHISASVMPVGAHVERAHGGGAPDPSTRLFNRITREMQHGDCPAAIEGFRLFVALHGESPLVPLAEYWRGDCEYRLERYGDAIGSFDRVLAGSPLPAALASSALLRKGVSYAKAGEHERSRHTLELVVAEFPGSLAAEAARAELVSALSADS